jgi:hypothetical protein
MKDHFGEEFGHRFESQADFYDFLTWYWESLPAFERGVSFNFYGPKKANVFAPAAIETVNPVYQRGPAVWCGNADIRQYLRAESNFQDPTFFVDMRFLLWAISDHLEVFLAPLGPNFHDLWVKTHRKNSS